MCLFFVFRKVSLSPNIILYGSLCLKHQLTNTLTNCWLACRIFCSEFQAKWDDSFVRPQRHQLWLCWHGFSGCFVVKTAALCAFFALLFSLVCWVSIQARSQRIPGYPRRLFRSTTAPSDVTLLAWPFSLLCRQDCSILCFLCIAVFTCLLGQHLGSFTADPRLSETIASFDHSAIKCGSAGGFSRSSLFVLSLLWRKI